MDINSIIIKKREKEELDSDEIKYFIGKYMRNEISDAQISALLSYIYINGLTEDEIVKFSTEIANSGDTLNLSEISSNIIDIHNLSILEDKISLILFSVLSAIGIPVAKIFGKAVNSSNGIIDKLISIPGFNPNINVSKFEENLKNIGIGIASQDLDFIPVEKRLEKLRNEIACSDSIDLIAVSLISLKIATGSNKIVFNLICGKGTYLKTKDEAKRFGKLLVKLGKILNKKVGYIISLTDEPVGNSIGNVLEIKETIKCLKGNMSKDVEDTVVMIANLILSSTYGEKDLDINVARILSVIKSGQAFAKFKQMVMAHGGNADYIESIDLLPEAKYKVPVYATENGYISQIDSDIVESLAKYLGVIRTEENSEIDSTAGIVLEKKIGNEVKVGEIVAYIHANDESKAISAVGILSDAFKYSSKPVLVKTRVLEIYGM